MKPMLSLFEDSVEHLYVFVIAFWGLGKDCVNFFSLL